jgi:hypothetical protein
LVLDSVADPGCLSWNRNLDPRFDFFHPGARADEIPDPHLHISIKDFKYFYPKKLMLPDPVSGFFSIPDPGSGRSKKHRIRSTGFEYRFWKKNIFQPCQLIRR